MKAILAIGGAVIKTALEPLRQAIIDDKVEMLIFNGGAIFHDFQIAMGEFKDGQTSYPLEELVESFECNRAANDQIWNWLEWENKAPDNSITKLCEEKGIPVMVFTSLGCDFWQMFDNDWSLYAESAQWWFSDLCDRFKKPFHYICMGSAVIHPEVFTKAIAMNKPELFKADVVDFKEMYRPRTRVAKYGEYYKMTHEEFFKIF